MTKIDATFDPEGYAPVAERIRLFYAAHPTGRIETELVRRTEHDVVFKALVFRSPTDERPAATGWACEREGDGDINAVACLENTETSAIGRALANLGFTASRQRPSAEEMAKASRARRRLARLETLRAPHERTTKEAVEPAIAANDPRQSAANDVMDALALLGTAERVGLRPRRAARWRRLMTTEHPDLERVQVCIDLLQRWIARRQRDVVHGGLRLHRPS